jgi:hypothetical protein
MKSMAKNPRFGDHVYANAGSGFSAMIFQREPHQSFDISNKIGYCPKRRAI